MIARLRIHPDEYIAECFEKSDVLAASPTQLEFPCFQLCGQT
jgi:hypothetical protein